MTDSTYPVKVNAQLDPRAALSIHLFQRARLSRRK
jgi:hypothetical protein